MTTKLYTLSGRLYVLHWELAPGSTGTPPIAAVERRGVGMPGMDPIRCIWAGREMDLASLDVLADFIGARITLFESVEDVEPVTSEAN